MSFADAVEAHRIAAFLRIVIAPPGAADALMRRAKKGRRFVDARGRAG